MKATQDPTTLFLGGGIFLIGLAVVVYAATTLDLGNFVQPGPGGFPFLLGLLLMVNGGASIVSSLRSKPEFKPDDSRAPLTLNQRVLLFIMLAIAVFGALIESFGLLPACFGLVLVATAVVRDMKLSHRLITAGLAAGLAVMIFAITLSVPVQIITTPFGGLQ